MSAYILVDIEVIDPDGYEEYRKLAPASIGLYGGRYLVRGGAVEKLEGEWPLKRLVILEFCAGALDHRLQLGAPIRAAQLCHEITVLQSRTGRNRDPA